jgi:CheY-like chemotaxis protein
VQDRKFSILIVEGHPFQLIAMQMHLNRWGFFRLTPALDANEAREECARRNEPFDLVLCDINLRESNGVDLLSELAEAGHIRQAIVLSCRDATDLQALHRALRERGLPVLACLTKPLDQWTLMQALEADESLNLTERVD